MDAAVASTTVVVQRPNEPPMDVTLNIGMPRQVGDDEWLCPVSLQPMFGRLADAHGVCAVQALCLAVSLGLELLHGVVEDGGSVSFAGGQAFPFDAYAFGVSARIGGE